MKNSKMMTKTPQNQSIYKKIKLQNDVTNVLDFLMSRAKRSIS